MFYKGRRDVTDSLFSTKSWVLASSGGLTWWGITFQTRLKQIVKILSASSYFGEKYDLSSWMGPKVQL